MSTVHLQFPNDLNFATECSGTGPDYAAEPPAFKASPSSFIYNLNWDSKNLIAGSLNNWASGVQLFNLALDQNAGPQNDGCKNCRGVITVNTTSHTVSDYNVDYYILAQAAAAFAPGAERIESSGPSSLSVTAALNLDGTTGLYVSNPETKSQTITVDDGGFGFTYNMAPSSVASFRWSN